MAPAAKGEASLLNSPTWAIALTCFAFIAISLLFEKAIELAEHLIHKYRQTSLQAAFHKVKDELMLVGFISIALTVGQSSVAQICVPKKASITMPLCKIQNKATLTSHVERILAAVAPQECSKGYAPFIPVAGFHQLHILIFILAIVHIIYSLSIVALGMWTVSYWKAWETRASNVEGSSNGGVRLAKEATFVKKHTPIPAHWMSKPVIPYVVAFFRQFISPVSETDYVTLRNGFIQNHTPFHPKFNFHKYIRRSLQDDFQHVVGISPPLWLFACIWLLINVEGWETKLWTAFIALFLVLIVGTKMQHIMTMMALQFSNAHSIAMGVPVVKLSDQLFWFSHPRFVLWCIHFILFQNALELSFVLWIYFTFSNQNCVYHAKYMLITRLAIGLVAQMLCGLRTLPSYAIVSQMGQKLKWTTFEKDIQIAVDRWHKRAKHHIHHKENTHSRNTHQQTIPQAPPPPPPSHFEISYV